MTWPPDGASAGRSAGRTGRRRPRRPARYRPAGPCERRSARGRDRRCASGRRGTSADRGVEVGAVGHFADPVDLLAVRAGRGRPRPPPRARPGPPACPRPGSRRRRRTSGRAPGGRQHRAEAAVAGRLVDEVGTRRAGAGPGSRPPSRVVARRDDRARAGRSARTSSDRIVAAGRRGWSPRTTRAASALGPRAAVDARPGASSTRPRAGVRVARLGVARASAIDASTASASRPEDDDEVVDARVGQRVEDVLEERPPVERAPSFAATEPACPRRPRARWRSPDVAPSRGATRPRFAASGAPEPPYRSATISARIASAVSAGSRPPRSSPIGPRSRPSSASVTPASSSRARRSAWVLREPTAPT